MIEDGGCFELQQIRIIESKKYSEKYLKKKLLDNSKKCFTKQDLRNIRKKIENFYLEKGFSTTRVYFDSKTLAQKILTLVVVEGKIEPLTELRQRYKLSLL